MKIEKNYRMIEYILDLILFFDMKQRLTLGKESNLARRKSPPQSATEHGARKHNLNVSASQSIPSLNPKK